VRDIMAKDKDMEIELAKIKQQIEDLAGSMRYGGGNRDLIGRLDNLIDVLSAAAMEEEEKGENKVEKLIEALTEGEDETDMAMQEVARSLAGIADAMKENTELLRETVKKLEAVQTDLKKEEMPHHKREKLFPKETPSKVPTAEKVPPIAEKPSGEGEFARGPRGLDLLGEKIPTKRAEGQPVDIGRGAGIFGEREGMPREESLEDILAEAEELGIDTSLIKEKKGVGGSVLPYLLGIVWLFLGIMKFLEPLEIPFLMEIDDFLIGDTVGMLFSVFLIVTGIPLIFIGMQGVAKRKTMLFNLLSYVTGAMWMAVGVIFLFSLMQEGFELEGIILLVITFMILASSMLSILIGVSISQKKFSV
jgi:hypothetical protein